MKRFLSVLFICLTVTLLASCGGESYKYTLIPPEVPKPSSTYKLTGKVITNGTLAEFSLNDIQGTELKTGSSVSKLRCIVDDEAKTLYPLCFSATCTHTDTNCFANAFYDEVPKECYGIWKDEIFVIGSFLNGKDNISAVYYSLDGTMTGSVPFDLTLTRPDGKTVEIPYSGRGAPAFIGSKLYFDVMDLADSAAYRGEDSQEPIPHWIVCYDLENKEFSLVASCELPYTASQPCNIRDISETELALYQDEKLWIISIADGTVRTVDCAEIVDRMVAEKVLPRGSLIASVYPLSDIMVVRHDLSPGEFTDYYCRLSTETLVELTEEQITVLGNGMSRYGFIYKGDHIILGARDEENVHYYNENTNTEICLNRSFGGKYMLQPELIETEKGLIYNYVTVLEDGSLEPEYYDKIENGETVSYKLPRKYVYVLKEDVLDGTVDEPYFYDPETGTFVPQS